MEKLNDSGSTNLNYINTLGFYTVKHITLGKKKIYHASAFMVNVINMQIYIFF